MDIRLIATDLDGTLLDGRGSVPAENLRALQECARRGIYVILASGREYESVHALSEQIELPEQPVIVANGARMESPEDGGTIFEEFVPEDVSGELWSCIKECGLFGEAWARGRYYAVNHPRGEGLSWEQLRGESLAGVHKYVVNSRDPAEIARMDRVFRRYPLEVNQAYIYNLEALKKGVNKGTAIQRFAARKGIRKEQIMAFGDYENDRAMLEAAGWPVAMENGHANLKRAARIIAPPNTEAGVGRVIEKYVLNGDAGA